MINLREPIHVCGNSAGEREKCGGCGWF